MALAVGTLGRSGESVGVLGNVLTSLVRKELVIPQNTTSLYSVNCSPLSSYLALSAPWPHSATLILGKDSLFYFHSFASLSPFLCGWTLQYSAQYRHVSESFLLSATPLVPPSSSYFLLGGCSLLDMVPFLIPHTRSLSWILPWGLDSGSHQALVTYLPKSQHLLSLYLKKKSLWEAGRTGKKPC